ncbi:MAG TPA: GreA/GreB family elongation factor [candidate division Zixibacteria bacterium]|nr:GreA/GreB family elongation factor [candidate division Zixibacteria bacterium]
MAEARALVADVPARRGRWLMTREAWEALEADAARLTEEAQRREGFITGRLDGEPDAPVFVPNVSGQQIRRQLATLREVLATAEIVEEAGVAVIGRRVTLDDGEEQATYALVPPGSGDPDNGFISADSPVGRAVLGARVGEEVTIQAPGGRWTARVVKVEQGGVRPRPGR